MAVTFPTGRDRGVIVGTPVQAKPCEGHTAIGEKDDTCVLCGHYPQSTIERTWARRARVLAMREAALG